MVVIVSLFCLFWMVDMGGLETGSDVAKNDPELSCVPLSLLLGLQVDAIIQFCVVLGMEPKALPY